MSDQFFEQQINIMFCEKLRKKASDTWAVLSETYGREAMKSLSVLQWHKWFKEGLENMEDNDGCGHPKYHRTDEHVEKVWNMVYSDNNQAYYVEKLMQLCEAEHRKRPELWPNDWILHHDNASVHIGFSLKQFWPKN
jgi:hypothetical protein